MRLLSDPSVTLSV
jgi:hypothetical protein